MRRRLGLVGGAACFAAGFASFASVACSGHGGSGFGTGEAGSSDAGSSDSGRISSSDSAGLTDSHVLKSTDASSLGDGSQAGNAVVYGQSGSTLYAVDPNTKAVTVVGDFQGCDSDVIDLALDKNSNLYATTFGGIYTVDIATVTCHLIQAGIGYPNSLSFVPAGTLDPNVEALVGYVGSTYVRIETTTGAITNVGEIGNDYSSSGDIVSVINGGTYLTVTGGNDCSANDCLFEVSPTTGAMVTNYGSVGYSSVYGLAFWAGSVYGFDSGGDLFEVTFLPQAKISVTAIAIPNAPSDLSFNGAGSTTSAPPVPVAK